MDAAGVSALEEFLVEVSIFLEVFAKVKKDSLSTLLKVDLVTAYAVSSVVNSERCRFSPS